jgi:hypothetical protein
MDADTYSESLRTSREKFWMVVDTARLSRPQFIAYCLQREIGPAHLDRWRLACEEANVNDGLLNRANVSVTTSSDQMRYIRQLERALKRAEALLVVVEELQMMNEVD